MQQEVEVVWKVMDIYILLQLFSTDISVWTFSFQEGQVYLTTCIFSNRFDTFWEFKLKIENSYGITRMSEWQKQDHYQMEA